MLTNSLFNIENTPNSQSDYYPRKKSTILKPLNLKMANSNALNNMSLNAKSVNLKKLQGG